MPILMYEYAIICTFQDDKYNKKHLRPCGQIELQFASHPGFKVDRILYALGAKCAIFYTDYLFKKFISKIVKTP